MRVKYAAQILTERLVRLERMLAAGQIEKKMGQARIKELKEAIKLLNK